LKDLTGAALDKLRVGKRERAVLTCLASVQSMTTDRLARAAARAAGLRATAKTARLFKPAIAHLRELELIELAGTSRVRLSKRLFRREDDYVIDLCDAFTSLLRRLRRPVSARFLVRKANAALFDKYGEVRKLPLIVLKNVAQRGRARDLVIDFRESPDVAVDDGSTDAPHEGDRSIPNRPTPGNHDEEDALALQVPEGEPATWEDPSPSGSAPSDDVAYLTGILELSVAEGRREIASAPITQPEDAEAETRTTPLEQLVAVFRSAPFEVTEGPDSVRVRIALSGGRSQSLFLSPRIVGDRLCRVFELMTPIAPVSAVPDVDYARVNAHVVFGKCVVQFHRGVEYLCLMARFPASVLDANAWLGLAQEMAIAGDELEQLWTSGDRE
jgi:hypothetical protein